MSGGNGAGCGAGVGGLYGAGGGVGVDADSLCGGCGGFRQLGWVGGWKDGNSFTKALLWLGEDLGLEYSLPA